MDRGYPVWYTVRMNDPEIYCAECGVSNESAFLVDDQVCELCYGDIMDDAFFGVILQPSDDVLFG